MLSERIRRRTSSNPAAPQAAYTHSLPSPRALRPLSPGMRPLPSMPTGPTPRRLAPSAKLSIRHARSAHAAKDSPRSRPMPLWARHSPKSAAGAN